MKTKNFSCFWAICIAMILAFSAYSCSSDIEDLGLNPKPIPNPTTKDSLVIEVFLNAPEETVFSEAIISFYNEKLKSYNKKMFSDGDYTVLNNNERFVRFVYYDAVADSLNGSTCCFLPIFTGKFRNVSYEFTLVEGTPKNVIVKKGINKVTLDIVVIENS